MPTQANLTYIPRAPSGETNKFIPTLARAPQSARQRMAVLKRAARLEAELAPQRPRLGPASFDDFLRAGI